MVPSGRSDIPITPWIYTRVSQTPNQSTQNAFTVDRPVDKVQWDNSIPSLAIPSLQAAHPSTGAAPMPPSPPRSTLVLPQHILANPLDTLGRQSPLAALFALNACFVDESAEIVSFRPLVSFPAFMSAYRLRESVS